MALADAEKNAILRKALSRKLAFKVGALGGACFGEHSILLTEIEEITAELKALVGDDTPDPDHPALDRSSGGYLRPEQLVEGKHQVFTWRGWATIVRVEQDGEGGWHVVYLRAGEEHTARLGRAARVRNFDPAKSPS